MHGQTQIKKKTLVTRKLNLNLSNKLEKSFIWSIALCDAGTLTLQKVDQKYLESFETRCWESMEKIIWTDHVRNEKVLQRVKEERKIEQIIKRKMACWIGHIMCRNCLLKHVIEG